MGIGDRWRKAREAAGLTALAAGKAIGVHENTIYLIENDKKNDGVTVRLAKRIADCYGVSLGEIYNDEGIRTERVPQEFRPLIEPLAPLTRSARESIVRNIASNLRFMSMLYSGAAENSQSEGSISSIKNTIIPDSNSSQTDELRDYGVSGGGSEPRSRGAGATTGKAGRTPRRQHGKAAR